MIDIKQYSPITKELNTTLSRLGETRICLDGEIIREDIERLEKMLENTFSKNDKFNIKQLIRYANRMLKKSTTFLDISWFMEDGLAKAYPLELKYYPEYCIDAINYITTSSSEKVVEISYSGVADLIAYEIMHRDIGDINDENIDITMSEIEKRLDDIGIISINDFSILKERFFKSYSPYKYSKMFKVNESPYIDLDKKKIKDYFGHKEFDIDKYYDVVDYSTKHAMALIFKGLTETKLLNNFNWKLVAINNDRIVLILNVDDDFNIEERLSNSVVVRVFGRRFEVAPEIKVY